MKTIIQIRIDEHTKRMWEAEAAIEGHPSLSHWIRFRCNEKRPRHTFGDYARIKREQLEAELLKTEAALAPPHPPFKFEPDHDQIAREVAAEMEQ